MKKQTRLMVALAILLSASVPAHAKDPALPTKAVAMEAIRTKMEIPVALAHGQPFILSSGKPKGPEIEPLRFLITDRILIRQGDDWIPFENREHGPTLELYYAASHAAGFAPYIEIKVSERSLDAPFAELLRNLQERAVNGPEKKPLKTIYLHDRLDDPEA